MTTSPSSSAYAVTFSVTAPVVSTAPFVPPVDITPVEPGHKQHRVKSLREKANLLAAFEELWASCQSLSVRPGLSSAPKPPLVTLPVAITAPIPPVVPVTVSFTSAATSSLCSDSSSCSVASSSHSCKWSLSRRSPGPCPAPLWSPSVPALAARGSWSRHLSGTWSRS